MSRSRIQEASSPYRMRLVLLESEDLFSLVSIVSKKRDIKCGPVWTFARNHLEWMRCKQASRTIDYPAALRIRLSPELPELGSTSTRVDVPQSSTTSHPAHSRPAQFLIPGTYFADNRTTDGQRGHILRNRVEEDTKSIVGETTNFIQRYLHERIGGRGGEIQEVLVRYGRGANAKLRQRTRGGSLPASTSFSTVREVNAGQYAIQRASWSVSILQHEYLLASGSIEENLHVTWAMDNCPKTGLQRKDNSSSTRTQNEQRAALCNTPTIGDTPAQMIFDVVRRKFECRKATDTDGRFAIPTTVQFAIRGWRDEIIVRPVTGTRGDSECNRELWESRIILRHLVDVIPRTMGDGLQLLNGLLGTLVIHARTVTIQDDPHGGEVTLCFAIEHDEEGCSVIGAFKITMAFKPMRFKLVKENCSLRRLEFVVIRCFHGGLDPLFRQARSTNKDDGSCRTFTMNLRWCLYQRADYAIWHQAHIARRESTRQEHDDHDPGHPPLAAGTKAHKIIITGCHWHKNAKGKPSRSEHPHPHPHSQFPSTGDHSLSTATASLDRTTCTLNAKSKDDQPDPSALLA
ncbi:hypothetical protein OG21DRAFT_1602767 [Imleria badia]|nr:hypothetical protein OG21DRAFT_1602767 [Imleria badia]